jgi:CRP/FNR family cyclic AMP-dependent transcriptional regulator
VAPVEELLGRVELFRSLTRSELRAVVAAGREVEFPAGAVIVEVGLRGDDFYLLLEGEARVEVPNKPTRTIGAGESFGEISVLDGGPRTATITAESRVLAFRLGREAFTALLDRHGTIGRKILVEMCGRLRYAEARMAPT